MYFVRMQQYIYNNLRLALQNGRTNPQLMANFSPLVMQAISQQGIHQPPLMISMQLQQQQAQIAGLPPLAQQIITQCLQVCWLFYFPDERMDVSVRVHVLSLS